MLLFHTGNVPERLAEKLLKLHDLLMNQVVYNAKFFTEEAQDLDVVDELLDEYIDIATRFAERTCIDSLRVFPEVFPEEKAL